jgi:hypothetical protein
VENDANREQPAEVAGADLGSQLRSAVGRLNRRFRGERPQGSLGDAIDPRSFFCARFVRLLAPCSLACFSVGSARLSKPGLIGYTTAIRTYKDRYRR